jgi:hypothetical protein
MHLDVAFGAQRTHELPKIPMGMTLRQIVMRFLGWALTATLAFRMRVEEKPVPLLPSVGLAGALLRTPCTGITHFHFSFRRWLPTTPSRN